MARDINTRKRIKIKKDRGHGKGAKRNKSSFNYAQGHWVKHVRIATITNLTLTLPYLTMQMQS